MLIDFNYKPIKNDMMANNNNDGLTHRHFYALTELFNKQKKNNLLNNKLLISFYFRVFT